jgi:hypothetical protein
MQIKAGGIPASQFMPCSKRSIKETFAEEDLDWVDLAFAIKSFSFDSAWSHHPKLNGQVVAQLTVPRNPGKAYLIIYPMHRDRFTGLIQEGMKSVVLPRFRDWLNLRKRRPETAVLGYETILADWNGRTFEFHEGRYR